MLQEKYLPQFHFSEKHNIVINSSGERVSKLIPELEASSSSIVRLLLLLRGIPRDTGRGIEGWKKMGFSVLEYRENKEIILGLIGQFWKLEGNIQRILPEEFVSFYDGKFAKATWNFEIKEQNENQVLLETETRIFCMDEGVRKKFSRYWFFVRPFSGLIRMEMLRLIKRKAERD